MALQTYSILMALALAINANEYCSMRSLCPQGEHLGCSYNEDSWRSVPRGPIPLKRSSYIADDERQLIVELHNQLRRSLAYGENDTQSPPRTISNMRELQWNDQLAYLARIRVSLFQARSNCADLPKYQVGINQYIQSFPLVSAPDDNNPWQAVTKYWYSFSRFVAQGIMKDLKAFRDLAQFAQMLWPTTYEIGCASNNFITPGGYMRNVICFYGPVARCDDDTNPYSFGEPASNCTAATMPKEGLCAIPSVTTTTTIPSTEEPITNSPTPTAPTTEVPDCESLGNCTTTTTEPEPTNPPSTTVPNCEPSGECSPSTTTPSTEEPITNSPTPTTPITEVPDCKSLGNCTTTTTEPEPTNPPPTVVPSCESSGECSPTTSEPEPTTLPTTAVHPNDCELMGLCPTTITSPQPPASFPADCELSDDCSTSAPEPSTSTTTPEPSTSTTTPEPSTSTTTPEPSTLTTTTTISPTTTITTPCKSNNTQPTSPINPDSVDIFMKVFRYICELLAISPTNATVNLANVTHMLL